MSRIIRYGLSALFVITVLAQLAVPVSMIVSREITLREGSVYHFRTRPVDPYDAFRGRYVALGFEQQLVAVTNTTAYRSGRRVFVSLGTDTEGFAQLTGVSFLRPSAGAYLTTRVQYVSGTSNVNVNLPFDRYYMNECDAPAAEQAYNMASRREGGKPAYVVVRVRHGMAVIEDLMVEDSPIRTYLTRSP